MGRLIVVAGFVGAVAVGCGPGASRSAGSESSRPAQDPAPNPPAGDAGQGTPVDAGSGDQQDGGVATDGGGSSDGGSDSDGGTDTDGGTVAALPTVPCPEAPHLLWSRTFKGDVSFQGTVDEAGNIYWIEYDSPRTDLNPDPPATLVSVHPDGVERYRQPISMARGLVWAAGKLISSRQGTVVAYDDATGAVAWRLDFAACQSVSAAVGGFLRAASATVAVAVNDGSTAGIYFVDAKSGAIVAKNVSSTDKGRAILASDGAGSVLVSANAAAHFPYQGDVLLMDASGTEIWREHIADAPPWIATVIAWPAGLPWLQLPGGSGISSNGHHWTTANLFRAAFTGGIGIGFDTASVVPVQNGNRFPLGIDVIRDHRVVARTFVDGLDTFNGIFVSPFAIGDHVDFVAQDYHHIAGLCHMIEPGRATFGQADSSSTFQCPLAGVAGDDFIDVTAVSAGHLVIGKTTLTTTACTSSEFDPVSVEVYSLPAAKP
jgi:hypothetical protein